MTDKKTTEKKETETAATFTEELTAVLEESTELLKIIVMPLILNA